MLTEKYHSCLLVQISVLALVCASLVELGLAQKTAQRWSSYSSSREVSRPVSVYGGYNTASNVNEVQVGQQQQQQQLEVPVSPVKQHRTQSSSSFQSSSFSRKVNRPQPRPVYQQQQQQESAYESQASSQQLAEADAEPASYGSVNGQAGQDFPSYARVPKTSFTCKGKPYDYGMYADEETGCQAYHLCYNGRKDSFLCGPGTVFNQQILHCDYWYSVDCGKSSQYYGSNAYMGSSKAEPAPVRPGERPELAQPDLLAGSSSSSSSSSSSYKRTRSKQSFVQQQRVPQAPVEEVPQQTSNLEESASSSFGQEAQQAPVAY